MLHMDAIFALNIATVALLGVIAIALIVLIIKLAKWGKKIEPINYRKEYKKAVKQMRDDGAFFDQYQDAFEGDPDPTKRTDTIKG